MLWKLTLFRRSQFKYELALINTVFFDPISIRISILLRCSHSQRLRYCFWLSIFGGERSGPVLRMHFSPMLISTPSNIFSASHSDKWLLCASCRIQFSTAQLFSSNLPSPLCEIFALLMTPCSFRRIPLRKLTMVKAYKGADRDCYLTLRVCRSICTRLFTEHVHEGTTQFFYLLLNVHFRREESIKM